METTIAQAKANEAKPMPPSFVKGEKSFFSGAGKGSFFAPPAAILRKSGTPDIQRDDKKKKDDPVTGGLSTLWDNLDENNEKWKPFKDHLKLKLWDQQPDEFKYGMIGFGLTNAAILATLFSTDQLFRTETIKLLKGKNIAAPLSLIPGSDYFILNSFKYKLPADNKGKYEFSSEYDLSPYMKLMFKDKTLGGIKPKFGLDLDYNPTGHSLSVSGFMFNISALNGALSLTGGFNQPLVSMPRLFLPQNPEDQPVWLNKEIPSHTSELKDNHFLITVDVGKLLGQGSPKKKKKPAEVQPKLEVNEPGDPFEREADEMANRVMRMKDPSPGAASAPASSSADSLQRKCAHCEEEEKKKLQRKETGDGETEAGGGETESGAVTESYVGSLNGRGRSLATEEKDFFESRFGYDFPSVELHTGAEAGESAQSINALAYTFGNHIVFGAGQYQPGTETGKKLLAHELTHVVQQGKGVSRKVQRACDAAKKSTAKQATIRIFVLANDDGSSPVAAPHMIKVDRVWERCCIHMNVGDVKTIKDSGSRILDVGTTNASAEETALASKREANTINIFMVESFRNGGVVSKNHSGGGRTFYLGSTSTASILVQGAVPTVVAHEIGHALRGNTDHEAGTIMEGSGAYDKPNPDKVSSTVCSTARSWAALTDISDTPFECCLDY